MWSDFGALQNKVSPCFYCFPIYLAWSDGTGCHDLSFFECWALSQLFHSPLTFFKRLFSSSSLSAVRVVSSAYLRLLIFLLANLTPVCASSGPAFLMMYCAYKLNKQGDNIQPWHTSFSIYCSMSSSNCCFLTCIQVSQEAGQVVWYSHLFPNFPQFIVIHTFKEQTFLGTGVLWLAKYFFYIHICIYTDIYVCVCVCEMCV